MSLDRDVLMMFYGKRPASHELRGRRWAVKDGS